MASISSNELARELLAVYLRDGQWPDALAGELIQRALSGETEDAQSASRALFSIVVERLSDLFEPRLTDGYVELFSRVIEQVRPEMPAARVRERYSRVRAARRFSGSEVERVYVLSRVTLGADVAITSVVLDAMKRRFPEAKIIFAGSRKNWALFENDPRIELLECAYRRGGSLRERLSSTPAFDTRKAIVVDPDSRLTQLGLLPVCEDERYYFFESRSYGADSESTLQDLTRDWLQQTFGITGARAYIDPAPTAAPVDITASFGVGDNLEKRVEDPFEARVLEHLSAKGAELWVDTGAGGREREQVEAAAAALPVKLWRGEYAPFASQIARSRLFVGYDSAGQHVAAACGVPLVSVFAGYASERMFQRWRPAGAGPVQIVKVSPDARPDVLTATIEAVDRLLK